MSGRQSGAPLLFFMFSFQVPVKSTSGSLVAARAPNASANEQTYYSVRWNSRNVLQVRVHHIVRSEIADTEWNETDIWTLSNDGKTLTNKLSDGKLIVYDRLDREKPLQY